MNPLNHSQVEGNFVNDPNITETKKGEMVCKFTVATDRFFGVAGQGTEKETSFIDVVAFGELAKICGQIGKKGRGCRVTGRLKQEKWIAEDKSKRSRLVIVAENIEYQSERRAG